MKTRARRAFSLVELMTVVGIIALLISILLPALSRAREAGRRTVCLANLRSIAQGSVAYAATNDSHLPEWGQEVAGFASIGEAWNWTKGMLPLPAASPISNTRNVWMLVRTQAGDPKTFICPSDDEAGEAFVPGDMTQIYDVQNRSQFSYSFQYQGPAAAVGGSGLDVTRTGWNTTLKDDIKLVIAADSTPCMKARNTANTDPAIGSTNQHEFFLTVAQDSSLQAFWDAMDLMLGTGTPLPIEFNTATGKGEFRVPGQSVQAALNSSNHKGEGQNVVRLDGSGEFSAHPWAGAHLDNIYTVQNPDVYTSQNLAAPMDAANQARHTDMLRGRMVGMYENYGGTYNYNQLGIMQAWVSNRVSKTRFPDSFLVP